MERSYNYKNIAGANAGIAIMSRIGILGHVHINNPVAAGTVTLYDNATAASGTKIATITLPAAPGEAMDMEYEITVANGLFVVTTGTGIDVTITFIP